MSGSYMLLNQYLGLPNRVERNSTSFFVNLDQSAPPMASATASMVTPSLGRSTTQTLTVSARLQIFSRRFGQFRTAS